jgi:type 1 glutamine amidotransferase
MRMPGRMRAFAAALVVGMLVGSAWPGSALAAEAKPADVAKMQAALPDKAPINPTKPRKVLVYGLANGFVHGSIPLGQETIKAIGEKTGAYTSVVSNDPANFDSDKLKDFDVVVLVSTTGHFLIPRSPDKSANEELLKAYAETSKAAKDAEKQRMQNLLEFVRGGKGLVGIHAATDAYYDAPEYGDVIGGWFNGHPWNEKVFVKIDDSASPLTEMFEKGKDIEVADEIYRFTSKGKNKEGTETQPYSRQKLHVLLSLDMADGKTNPKGQKDTDFGVAWIREAGTGRVFYCSLGHREEIYWNPAVLKFYLAGIQYAAGDLKADATPSQR